MQLWNDTLAGFEAFAEWIANRIGEDAVFAFALMFFLTVGMTALAGMRGLILAWVVIGGLLVTRERKT